MDKWLNRPTTDQISPPENLSEGPTLKSETATNQDKHFFKSCLKT